MTDSAMRLYTREEAGKDGYPQAWHDTIKHAVREDAGHRCVRCHHPYAKGAGQWSPCDERCEHDGPFSIRYWSAGEWSAADNADVEWWLEHGRHAPDPAILAAQWRILTVHHLDGDKLNCRWFNLMAACQRCHLQVQGRVRMERVYPWPHTEWFRPYAAGYYALTYLGEDLSRAETVARLDELLALEQMVA